MTITSKKSCPRYYGWQRLKICITTLENFYYFNKIINFLRLGYFKTSIQKKSFFRISVKNWFKTEKIRLNPFKHKIA